MTSTSRGMCEVFKAAEELARKSRYVDGEQVAASLEAIADQLQRPPLIAVVGEFNAGKSTLVNRLLDVDVLPTDVVPTTARPACIQYGDRPGVVLHRQSGLQELRAVDDLRWYARKGDDAADMPDLADVVSLDVFLPNNTLRELRLLDTPGISDPDHDTEATLEAIQAADAVIWCTTAPQAWKASEAAFCDRLSEDVRKTAILVITHADALNTDDEAKRVLRRVQSQTVDAFGHVLISSLVAQHGGEDGGLGAIRDTLRQQVVDRTDELRSAWACRQTLAVLLEILERWDTEYEGAISVFKDIKETGQQLDRSWAAASTAIEEAFSSTAAGFMDLFDTAGKCAQSILTRKGFKELKVKRKKGIFSDDYKVRKRKRWIETLDCSRIEQQHERIRMHTDTLTDTAIDRIGEALESFAREVESKLQTVSQELDSTTALATSLKESLSSIDQSFSLLVQQNLLLLKSVIRSAVQRTFGSIDRGGLYHAAALHEQEKKHKKKFPSGEGQRRHLKMCFSFDASAVLMQDGGKEVLEEMDERVKGLLSDLALLEKAHSDEHDAVREDLDGMAAALGISGNARWVEVSQRCAAPK